MQPQHELAHLCLSFESEWRDKGHADPSQAEKLVTELKAAGEREPVVLTLKPIQSILAHADSRLWDMAFVYEWPDQIHRALEDTDYRYRIEPNGEEWDIVRSNLVYEEWSATVDTYTMAEKLISVLQSPELDGGIGDEDCSNDGPGTYECTVFARSESDLERIEIEASSQQEAMEKAIEMANDTIEFEMMDKAIEIESVGRMD